MTTPYGPSGGSSGPNLWANPFSSSYAVPLAQWYPAGPPTAPGSLDTANMLNWFTIYGPYSAIGINTQPLIVVPEGQALVPVSGNSANFTTAPIPSYASKYITGSGDSPLIVYQPSTGLAWEMYGSHSSGGAWSTSDGIQYSGMGASNGALDQQYHISAGGLSYLGTLITNADVARAEAMAASGNTNPNFGHVVALQVNWEQLPFLPPAISQDGGVSNTPFAPPEGAWFYMPSNVAMPAGMCPLAQYLFNTLKLYGCIVTDITRGNGVYFLTEVADVWTDEGFSGTPPITTALNGQPAYAALAAIPLGSMVQIAPPPTGAPRGNLPSAPVVTLTPGANTLQASWATESDVTQYIVQYRESSGPGPWQTYLPASGQNPTTSPVTIDGLDGTLSFDVQVWAVNANGMTPSAIVAGNPTGNTWGFIQGGTTIQSWNQGNVITLGANVTAGNMLVMASASYNTTTSITDNQGNVWTQAKASASGTGSYFAEVWTTTAKTSGSLTVTRNGNGIWTVAEYHGPTAVDANGSNTSTGSRAIQCQFSSPTTGTPSIVLLVGSEGNNKSFQNGTAVGPGLTQRSTNVTGSSGCLLADMTTDAHLAWNLLGQIPASTSWQAVVVELT